MTHPAQFHPNIIDALRVELRDDDRLVFDPFAGVGTRLGAMCNDLDLEFAGIDIEDWPDHDLRVDQGDATDLNQYPARPFVVVTSPSYPNGISDHFEPKDTSRRFTYRIALGQPLHNNNTGRYSIRGGKKSWRRYWDLATDAVECWSSYSVDAYVNVKSFVHNKEVVDLPRLWRVLMESRGYEVVAELEVDCPGLRMGANHDARVDYETILVATHKDKEWTSNCQDPSNGQST